MSNRAIAVAVLVAAVVAAAWWVLFDRPQNASSWSMPRISFGTTSTSPFGSSSAKLPEQAPEFSREQLQAMYLTARDKHALYVALKDRPEAEAKYLAYKAASDCRWAASEDGNDLTFQFRQELAKAPEQSRELAERRKTAMDAYVGLCIGFTRPNTPPSASELASLHSAAASGGSLGAKIEGVDPLAPIDTAVVEKVFAEADPVAFRALILTVLAHRMPLASGVDPFAPEYQLAVDLAACEIDGGCGPENEKALAMCAVSGDCPDGGLKAVLLKYPLADKAQVMAQKISNGFQSRRVQLSVAKGG